MLVPWSRRALQWGLWGGLLLTALCATAWAQLQGGLQYHYVGCVRNEGQYVLADPTPGPDTAMTNDFCLARCRAQQSPYAGTQASQCFCGTIAGRPAEEASCSTPCPGQPAQACGGSGVLSLYTTMVSRPPPP